MHGKENICSYLPLTSALQNLVIPKEYLSGFLRGKEMIWNISWKIISGLLRLFLQFDFRCFMPACSPVTEQLTQYHVIPSDNPLSPINHYQTNQSPQFCTIKALRFWLCLPSNLIIAAPEQPPNHDWQASHVYCSLDLTEKKKWDILIVSIIKGPCVFPLIKIKSQYLWNNNGN